MEIPRRRLGRTDEKVSALGLGGEGVLRTYGREAEARELVRRALDLGVTYFESARAYAESEQYLGQSLGADRNRVFLASKSHNRRARGARAHLDESLALLRTDHLDLWFVHDVRTENDLEAIAGPGGAWETLVRAREAGEVRFLGVSGHQSPEILVRALELLDVDCVLMPVNPAEAFAGSFAEAVLPIARTRDLGVVAMKTLCRGLAARVPGWSGPGPFLSYALSTPGIAVASVGCDDPEQLRANAGAVATHPPMTPEAREALEQQVFPYQRDLLYYRTP